VAPRTPISTPARSPQAQVVRVTAAFSHAAAGRVASVAAERLALHCSSSAADFA
jgi:hypothetical protein